MNETAFFELFHPGLPRLGPGSSQDTARALSLISGLPAAPDVLDVGCGNGAQTLDLARLLPGARITAVDALQPVLDELNRRAAKAGVADRIRTQAADMAALPLAAGSFDLIWSEGAVDNMGFAEGLAAWRGLLRPGGCLALTDIVWFKPDPPAELLSFWQEVCPGMTDEQTRFGSVRAQGYELLGQFRLPPESWWRDYYDPLACALGPFRQRHAGQPDWLAVAEATEMELSMHRKYADYFGYTFFVCRRSGEARIS